jgi:hypothetical protein
MDLLFDRLQEMPSFVLPQPGTLIVFAANGPISFSGHGILTI